MTRKSKKTNVEGTDTTDTHSPDRAGSVSSVHYDGPPSGGKKSKRAPTVSDIIVDPITQLAGEHWASKSQKSYHPQMVVDIFKKEILKGGSSRLQLLDVSGYLECYLWEFFEKGVSFEHITSIVLIVNEKYKNGLTALDELSKDAAKCQIFYETIVDLHLTKSIPTDYLMEQYCLFLINSFRSMENTTLRQCALRYLSLPIWESLSQTRLSIELSNNEELATHWKGYNAHKKELQKITSPMITPATEACSPPGSKGSAKKKTKSSTGKRKHKEETLEKDIIEQEDVKNEAQLELNAMNRDSTWFPTMIQNFLDEMCTETIEVLNENRIKYLERFAELLIDLLSQLPTRRFLKVLLQDWHFMIICRHSSIFSRLGSDLFQKLLFTIDKYIHFEVDDNTGKALTSQDMLELNNHKIHVLQQIAYTDYPIILKNLIFCSVGELSKKEYLLHSLQLLDQRQLIELGKKLNIITDRDFEILSHGHSKIRNSILDLNKDEILWELLLDDLLPRSSHIDDLNMMSLYPTEQLLWDYSQLPVNSNSFNNEVLALPKLNLQFLSIHDYLLRNFTLFRLESAYEIRDDLTDAIRRMNPKLGLRNMINFTGWARMALPIVSVSIDEVTKPKLGEMIPRKVDCTVTFDISRFTGDMRAEWQGFREHDVVFLVCIEAPLPDAVAKLIEFESKQRENFSSKKEKSQSVEEEEEEFFDFARTFGVKYVRGGELFELRDEANVVLNDPTRPDERKTGPIGNQRKLRLHLDPAQYYQDIRDGIDCYENLNLVIRRNAKENNFKAILQTIRELINTAAVGRAIPAWMHDVFLGYGKPNAAHYRSLMTAESEAESIDYGDTFLDAQHVLQSFPSSKVVFEQSASSSNSNSSSDLPPPPYRITVSSSTNEEEDSQAVTEKSKKKSRGRKSTSTTPSQGDESEQQETLTVQPYSRASRGPYPEDAILLNKVRFTPTQVEAIRSGTNRGLTMVVGPPGTGKTDVAVQIIVNLYRNHPTQKILIVTHSNAALNDLFEKIMERDVAPRHLLRLGSGEMELRETLAVSGAGGGGKGQGEAFSKQGRVNWSLARRLQLLSQVQKLSFSIGVPGDMGNTCETAAYFQLEHIQSRIEKFNLAVRAIENTKSMSTTTIASLFPFAQYFEDAPEALFSGNWEADVCVAQGCFTHISKIFEELADYRAFELLRTQTLRSDFLLTKQARIVAMTCTHAAMTRSRLVELGFKYDSIIMEEAAQVLEVETLIPMLLQDTDPVDGCRLKRVVLIGDHHQLPPVVKHMAFQKFSKLDQSLFTRFIRLGVPAVTLDRQGRARAEIAALYSWRYQTTAYQLGDLPAVQEQPEYLRANSGFVHTVQFINVPDFQAKGESCPTPYFYQNLGEAEYIVAVYQYMRLLGYPAEKISIITTYNGQKQLIQDIVSQRCKNAIFGYPGSISTVDKFQGQQNDFILLSLVRTESVGHIRDIRRLVVALSRARLGLYVFGRQSLYENCYELTASMSQLFAKPTVLQLVVGEEYPASDRRADGSSTTTADSSSSAKKSSKKAIAAQAEVMTHDVADVTAMGVLVYQMVQQAQSLQQQSSTAMAVVEST